MADDDEWAPIERPDEIAMAEVEKAKSKKLSKVDKVWPAQAVKIESVVNCATVHKGMKSTSRPSSHPSTPSVGPWCGPPRGSGSCWRDAQQPPQYLDGFRRF